jgi:cytochrome oxidase assembly protein ShyY1
VSYRFLLSRRWAIITLIAVVLIPTMIRLGLWQLHRHESRVAHNNLIADSLGSKPVPVTDLIGAGTPFVKARTWRTVTATGHYDTAHQVVVRQRTAANGGGGSDDEGNTGNGGEIGYYLVTPLILADGKAVLVNRGWIKPGENITEFPKVPATPSGQVTVTGRLRPDETPASTGIKNRSGLPDRQVMLISSRVVAKEAPEALLSGYIELTGTVPAAPAPQPQLVPAPDHTGIGPHLAYTVQWWLFSAMVPVGWVVLARRDRKELLEAAAKRDNQASQPGGSGPPGGTDEQARAQTPPTPGDPATGPDRTGPARTESPKTRAAEPEPAGRQPAESEPTEPERAVSASASGRAGPAAE